jgi:adenylate kinase
MNIVLLGAPASGKGTQAKLISQKFGLFYFSAGDLARDLAKKDERIREIVDSGKLIPEEEMTKQVIAFLEKEQPFLDNILFDGFPRFITQYEALRKFLESKGKDIDVVFSIDISKDVSVKRIMSRRICPKCGQVFNLLTNPPKVDGKCDNCGSLLVQRTDDTPSKLETRFEYYKSTTEPLIDYLLNKGVLIRVDGDRPIDVISQEIIAHIESLQKERV